MKSDLREDIFKRYYKRLCLYAYRLLDNMTLAEDFVQDAFCSYFDKKDNVSTDEKAIKQYLYSSVKFLVYNHYRKNKAQERYRQLIIFEEADERSLEREMIYVEVLNEVYEIIGSMPMACANIFRKGYLEGLSNKEISEELNISINTVKTQKQRGMKILLSKLHPEYLPLITFLLL